MANDERLAILKKGVATPVGADLSRANLSEADVSEVFLAGRRRPLHYLW
jgi:hypothetical protein